ncbi:MAG: hypothetical protein H0W70_01525 [Actinobacteria bacterium]|nr:hypothetical protein [Actinomycetota bacterium]
MNGSQRSLGEVTLGDLGRALARYRPFILAVGAVLLVVFLLPGTPKPTNTGTQVSGRANFGTSAADASGESAGASSSGSDGTNSGANAASALGGGSFSGTRSGAAGTNGSPTAPANTSDPFCDPVTGRVKVPSLYAPPCVPPYGGKNGGATYQGVTATTITFAVPEAQPNAATAAILAAGGDTDTRAEIEQTLQNYVDLLEHHFQTYGRKIKLVFFESAVNPNDSDAAQNSEAQADAIKIAKEIKAYLSLGDAGNPAAFYDTLVANHVPCICTTTLPHEYYLERAPYVWGNSGLPDETQVYSMRAEMLCNEINPYPPQFAGEADLNAPTKKARTYALMWPSDPSNAYKAGADFFVQRVKDQCGIHITDVVSFPLSDITNPAQAQADAQTDMAKFKSDRISSIIFVGDPVTPVYFTSAATKQQYFPEWIQTGSALTDTAFFARLYDPQQWKHNFGFSALGDRVPKTATDSFTVYNWQFNATPPAKAEYTTLYPRLWGALLGVHSAGPNLNPRTFQCGAPPFTSKTTGGQPCVGKSYPGVFGYPISPTAWQKRVTNPVIAFGTRLWQWDDYNQSDDGTLIWWDPNASGPNESGVEGNGLYRYVNNGTRYMYKSFPKAKIPWFDPNNTQLIFPELPAADRPPTYTFACYYLCNSLGY